MAAHLSGTVSHGPRLTPLAFSPALWLDFSDASTLFTEVGGSTNVAAGGTIAQVNDKSGNGRHATQSVLGSRPTRQVGVIGGRDVARMSGNRYLSRGSLNLNQPFTAFAVSNGQCRIFDSSGGTRALLDSAAIEATIYAGATPITLTGLANSARIFTAVFNGASSYLKSNTTALSSVTTIGSDRITNLLIGWDGLSVYSAGDIAEILVYPTAMTTDQRQRVEQYLNLKYSIY